MTQLTQPTASVPRALPAPGRPESDRLRTIVASVAGVLVGGIPFWLTLLDFGHDVGRTARSLRYGSNFFDLQGRAILDGHLWVRDGSLGIEGFVHHGHTYMYFGPFPALLRLPVLLLTHDFDGQMTLVSMGIAWSVFAVMSSRLLWLVRRCLVGVRPVSRFDAVLAAVFLAAATGGTVLTFDASLPWVYHEVYLWSAALVVTALFWMARVALEPTPVALRWLGLVALCLALTRTPAGWGVCLAILVMAAWMRWGRTQEDRRHLAGVLFAIGAVPLTIAITINLAKFGHVYLFPLHEQVWTQVNAHRREALRVNGGTIAGPQFFLTSLVNYFNPAGIRFVDYFPWITLPAGNAKAYGGAFIDQSYRTGSVTAFSTLLLVLALIALPAILRRRRALPVLALRAPALAAILTTSGVMAYGYVSYRYTSEFVPALVLGGAIGLWTVADLLGRSLRWARTLRWLFLGVAASLTAFAILANTAVGFATAAQTYRGAPLERYVGLQQRISGGPDSELSRMVGRSDEVPGPSNATDTLHIKGDCDGLFLNTGDIYEPWTVVQQRSHVVQVEFAARFKPGDVRLFTVHGVQERSVWLRTHEQHLAQILLKNEDGTYYGPLFSPTPGQDLRVGVGTDTALGYAEVTSTPGGFVGYLPMTEWDSDWVSHNGWVSDDVQTVSTSGGVSVRPRQGLALPLCRRIARDAGIDVGK